MGCPKLAEGSAIRLTRVDSCGRPVEGEDNAVQDDCWASVQMEPNVRTATDIELIGMTGQTCAFKRGRPDFRGFDVTATFFGASPEEIEILTGNPVYFDHDGNPVGWDDCQVSVAEGFALEIWQEVIGEECAEDSDSGQWFYWLLPWLTGGVLGGVTVGAEGLQFTLTAATRANNLWYLGPWDVQAQDSEGTAGPLLTPIGSTCHRRSFLTTVAPPSDIECGYITVPPNNIS